MRVLYHRCAQIAAELPTYSAKSLVLLTLLLGCALQLGAQAQSNYAYVYDQNSATVAAYSVSATGATKALSGSPYSTGGAGNLVTCLGLDQITLNAASNLMFVANGGDQTISVFQINPADGTLTAAAGSPFPSGLTVGSCQGMSLAATPDGKFLMAASNGLINSFSVSPAGALAPLASTANSSVTTAGMKISTNGLFLALSNETSVSVYTIDAAGALAPVAGSPFATGGTGLLSGLDFSSCGNNRLYGGEAVDVTSITDAWSVDAAGVLTPITGSPFSGTGANSNVVLLSPDNGTLFQSNQFSNSVTSYSLLPDGGLAQVGVFGSPLSIHVPVGMATNASGSLLYIADENLGLAVFKIDGSTLTPIGETGLGILPEIQGVAAYPPHVCTNADLPLAMTAAPDPVQAGSNVTYSITLTNNGPDAASTTITDVLPPETTFFSCSATAGGVCGTPSNVVAPNTRTVSFASLASGASSTITLVAQSSADLLNGSSVSNVVVVSNSSAVDANLNNNSAIATVSVSAPQVASTLFVPPVQLGSYKGSARLTATLKRQSNGATVSGRTVSFTLNGSSVGSAITDAQGVASLNVDVSSLAVGVYSGAISASFAGDLALGPSSGAATLEIKARMLTVVAGNAFRPFGDPNPAFTYTITGFAAPDTAATVVTGSASCTSPATPASPFGDYPILCSQGTLALLNSNYTFVNADGGFSTIAGVLSVRQPLVVTIPNVSRGYGINNPGLTGTISGLLPGDVITATYTTSATITSPVGTYAITPVFSDPGGALFKYAVKIVGGVFTITPASLQVKINSPSVSRAYGAANPAFPSTISGLLNGDPISVAYNTTATQASPVGTYPITATFTDPQNKLGNYTVTEQDGTLTITKAALTVTAQNQTVVLNGTVAPLANFAGFVLGEGPANLGGTLACNATVSQIGTGKVITCSGLTSANYAITFAQGVATVVYAPAGSCTAGPGHQYLGSNSFTRAGLTTIPVAFRVCDAHGTAVSTAGIVTNFTLVDKTSLTGTVLQTINQGLSAGFAFQTGAQDDLLNLAISATSPGSGVSAGLPAGAKYDFVIKFNDGSTIPFTLTMN